MIIILAIRSLMIIIIIIIYLIFLIFNIIITMTPYIVLVCRALAGRS